MDNVITLFEYHVWATNRMIQYIGELDQQVFHKKVDSVFSSICETMEHIYTVDTLWLKRLSGKIVFEEVSFSSASDAKNKFNDLHYQMSVFINEADLNEKVEYSNSTGTAFENKISEIFYHIANHGTYHRGNVTAMLRSMGSKSISTDFIYYLRETEKSLY